MSSKHLDWRANYDRSTTPGRIYNYIQKIAIQFHDFQFYKNVVSVLQKCGLQYMAFEWIRISP